MADKTYQQGVIDGISLWGRVCGFQGNCDVCPIGSVRGTGVTCQDFAKQFPAKMASILKEMDEGQLTYYQEFCTRFPNCELPIETLALTTCRKNVFEGVIDCPMLDAEDDGEACIKCWKEAYVADVTEESDSLD